MELSVSLPPELLAASAPLGRGPPELGKASESGPEPESGAAPFDLLLQLLGNPLPLPLPPGEALPVGAGGSGANGLPATPSALPAASLSSATSLALLFPGTAPPPALAAGDAPAPGQTAAPDAAAGDPAPLSLADALRSLLAPKLDGAPSVSAAAQPKTDVAPPLAADADPGLPAGTAPAAATIDAPTAEAARALDPAAAAPAAGAPLEAFAARLRALDDTRARPIAHASRPLAGAPGLASTESPDATRADSLPPRDAAAPATAFALLAAAARDDAAGAPLPVAITDAAAGAVQTTATSLGGHGPAAPQAAANAPPASPLPPHLGAPVDASSARWQEALSSRINWLVDHEIGEAQIKLNPPELGALDVKISMLDDKTHVQMTAHSAAARDELSQSLPRLRELLSAGGLDLGSATVSDGRSQGSGRQQGAAPVVRALPFADVADTPVAVQRSWAAGPSSSRIDLFA